MSNEDFLKIVFVSGYTPDWWSQDSFYIALHTADPGESGLQSANEVDYGGYSRVPVLRSEEWWNITGSSVSNAQPIQFPVCTGGECVATHVSIGLEQSGDGKILYCGALSEPYSISELVQPQFGVGALILSES